MSQDNSDSLWAKLGLISLPFLGGALFVWYAWCWPAIARILETPFARLSMGTLLLFGVYALALLVLLSVATLLAWTLALLVWGTKRLGRASASGVRGRFAGALRPR